MIDLHLLTYLNQRAKDKIKDRVDIPTFKAFIAEECSKVERFYNTKFEEIEQESEQLTVMMSQKSSVIATDIRAQFFVDSFM